MVHCQSLYLILSTQIIFKNISSELSVLYNSRLKAGFGIVLLVIRQETRIAKKLDVKYLPHATNTLLDLELTQLFS